MNMPHCVAEYRNFGK